MSTASNAGGTASGQAELLEASACDARMLRSTAIADRTPLVESYPKVSVETTMNLTAQSSVRLHKLCLARRQARAAMTREECSGEEEILRCSTLEVHLNFCGRLQRKTVERITRGVDVRTTLMARNVPPEMTSAYFFAVIRLTVPGQFDFANNRVDFQEMPELGAYRQVAGPGD